jgi:phosphoribosylformimino-5-aminoimidazole carboxamide ribotide isomerase
MRVIPVIDLRNGLTVHGVRGERERYRPVQSVLAGSADPLAVAGAFREQLGLSELYIADLDAIQGHGDHGPLIAALAKQEGAKLLVDAGAADLPDVLRVLATGSQSAIVGSETLASWEALQQIVLEIAAGRLIFSLDMRDGQVLTRCPQLADLPPLEVLEKVRQLGIQEVILLELTRVGTESGINRALISTARERFPGLQLITGGGIRDAHDLNELAALGVSGVLVATALHRGIITRRHVAALTHRS